MTDFSSFAELIKGNPEGYNNIDLQYNERPSTQSYYSVAAQNNPEFAQALADVHAMADLDRMGFNAGSDVLMGARRRKIEDEREKKANDNALARMKLNRKWNLEDRDHNEAILSAQLGPMFKNYGESTNWNGEVLSNENRELNNIADEYNNNSDFLTKLKLYNQAQIIKHNYANDPTLYKNTPVEKKFSDKYSQTGGFFLNFLPDKVIKFRKGNIPENSMTKPDIDLSFSDRISNILFGDKRNLAIMKLMKDENIGLTDWNSNNNTASIRSLISRDQNLKDLLDIEDIDELQLITDANRMDNNNIYVANKRNKRLYKIKSDNNGVLSVYSVED